jgi:hypothetical protein
LTDRREENLRLEEEKKKKLEQDHLAELENRKRIRPTPPGLRVFPDRPFKHFTEKSFKIVSNTLTQNI